MPDDSIAVMERFFGAFGTGDLDTAAALFAPDAVIHESQDLPFGGDYVGPDGFRALVATIMADYKFEILTSESLPAGERVVVRMGARFTSRRSGARAEFPVLEVYDVRDGLIRDTDVYYKEPHAVAMLHDAAA